MKQFNLKGKKGITLIALVITIIILIILASISISALSGDDGIINKAQSAKIKSENSDVTEGIRLKILEYQTDFKDNIKEQLLNDGIIDENGIINTKKLLNKNISTGQGSENDVYVIEKNNLYYYDKEENKTDLGYIANIEKIEYVMGDSSLFDVSDEGVLTLKNRDSYNKGDLTWTIENLEIPSQIDGKEVKAIGEGCFSEINLKNVKFPDSVIAIGVCAFQECASLESINIPSSVTTIESCAFSGCTSLASINIPDSVTTIGTLAFSWCTNLTSIEVSENNENYSSDGGVLYTKDKTEILQYPIGKKGSEYNIPSSVTTIGYGAFFGCTSLESVNISDTVTTIDEGAFAGCTSITSINIPSSVTMVGGYAFSYWTSEQTINIQDNADLSGWDSDWANQCDAKIKINLSIEYVSSLFDVSDAGVLTLKNYDSYYEGKIIWIIENLEIPSQIDGKEVKEIGEECFRKINLRTVKIADSVTTIGESAFAECTSLESINIPSSVTTIENWAFEGCTSLASINIPGSVVSISNYAFANCTSLESINIPSSVTTIGRYAFYSCTSLASINIPNSVTTIGESAFEGCANLESINIPNSVTTIGESAFAECTSLESINIPSSVTTIENWAFKRCTSLASINIPGSVVSISNYAFANCTSLASINIPSSVTTIGSQAFYNWTSEQTINIQSSSVPSGWSSSWKSGCNAKINYGVDM